MIRVFIQTVLALVVTLAGGYLSFIFLQGLADGSGTWAVPFAVPMLISGILLLHRAGKSDASVIKKIKIPKLGENKQDDQKTAFAKRLEENNNMSKEWEKTNDTRNQLRILKLSEEEQ